MSAALRRILLDVINDASIPHPYDSLRVTHDALVVGCDNKGRIVVFIQLFEQAHEFV
jgi:hypothetical protein